MIVAFTTIPPRFGLLGEALSAIEGQRLRPDAVELYLPKSFRRFPGERPSLPALPDWVTVIETETDLGPATKILPALDRWAGQDVDILFCDDDVRHDPDWAARFAAGRTARPDDVLCEYGLDLDELLGDPSRGRDAVPKPRAVVNRPTPDELRAVRKKMAAGGPGRPYLASPGYVDILMGFRGALIRPGWIDPRAWRLPDVLWTVDDVWLSGMIALAGRHIWAGGNACWMAGLTAASRMHDLYNSVIDGHDRDSANRHCVDYLQETYGLWR